MRTNSKTEKTLEKVYNFIQSYASSNGYPPTLREIMKEVNVQSTSTAKYYLDKLEESGLIKRSDNKKRALEVVNKDKQNSTHTYTATEHIDVKNNVIISNSDTHTKIPLIGQVAAGTPILAVENFEEVYEFSGNVFNKSGELFMLTIKGDSMINAGIYNKDKIVVKKQNYANNSDIVVAMINGSATVKRFFREQNRVRLQPENDLMQPIYCSEDIDILGKVVGLIRSY